VRSRQSLRLHDDANIDRDCRTIAREVAERETRFELLDVTNWPANWEHMSSEAYAAAYGTYLWATRSRRTSAAASRTASWTSRPHIAIATKCSLPVATSPRATR